MKNEITNTTSGNFNEFLTNFINERSLDEIELTATHIRIIMVDYTRRGNAMTKVELESALFRLITLVRKETVAEIEKHIDAAKLFLKLK